ncbi:hypothetical protein [Trabulsiella odontotermitis]|uniref:Uncharacterized protein n=1 Tax=Trabulsiella odontotermitis TaxID=379893 RepID=A0A0L0GV98_9ENTR|nr:hypothetical protein [Trabulsiella odontotermitis]KNC92912.1 hypothetical protein GM31_21525 [Trabulsiella odontotermitis]
MPDRIISPVFSLALLLHESASLWLLLLAAVLPGVCLWLALRPVWWSRRAGWRVVLRHAGWHWLVPVMLLGGGVLLLAVPSREETDTRPGGAALYDEGEDGPADTRCDHPELSGVALSAACGGDVPPAPVPGQAVQTTGEPTHGGSRAGKH